MERPHQIHLADGGEILHWPRWLDKDEAHNVFDELAGASWWHQRKLTMFGKVLHEPRLSAWIGDPAVTYTYSGRTHFPEEWPKMLLAIRQRLEALLRQPLNSVLANLYRGEQDSMGWHADNERELGQSPTIVSLSLGETRRFWLKHATAKTVRMTLEHGSLLVMKGSTQKHWKHCVPKETSYRGPRINLTFRNLDTGSVQPQNDIRPSVPKGEERV